MKSRLFLVLGRSRVGSNLLIHMLRQHPSISCRGEIFSRVTNKSWQTLTKMRTGPTPWVGFKMFYYHGNGDGGALWDCLVTDTELPVIHMKRRNKLRAVVSREIAAKTGQWATKDTDVPVVDKQVTLDPLWLERNFRSTERAEEHFGMLFQEHPGLEVEYEEIAACPSVAFERVIRVLGLDWAPIAPVTRKQNPEQLSQLIANYGELHAKFKDTRWAEFFSEDASCISERV
jgi:LPS sulfotransferase NodH